MSRQWIKEAIRRIDADFQRSADTHLYPVEIPGTPGVQLYLKDESAHPTGSLKHRLARSLFLYALANGWINADTSIIEASSGSTAISEAYFARMLGLRFIAVMPRSTSPHKIAQIEFYGGRCHLVDRPEAVYSQSHRLTAECGGHFIDQFTYAERATDWRGNNNIADSIFEQLAREPHPEPTWVVCGAGTGGTSATIGRYARYRRLDTRLCVADPENSVFYDCFRTGDRSLTLERGSRIEGIGRPRVEPSFIPEVIDRMEKVPDAASFAAVRFLEKQLGRRCGGSTGTNLIAAVRVMAEMHLRHESGSVVTLLCDNGERYRQTYFNDDWLNRQMIDIQPWLARLQHFYTAGVWQEPTKGQS